MPVATFRIVKAIIFLDYREFAGRVSGRALKHSAERALAFEADFGGYRAMGICVSLSRAAAASKRACRR
jgi:hypothetical protein